MLQLLIFMLNSVILTYAWSPGHDVTELHNFGSPPNQWLPGDFNTGMNGGQMFEGGHFMNQPEYPGGIGAMWQNIENPDTFHNFPGLWKSPDLHGYGFENSLPSYSEDDHGKWNVPNTAIGMPDYVNNALGHHYKENLHDDKSPESGRSTRFSQPDKHSNVNYQNWMLNTFGNKKSSRSSTVSSYNRNDLDDPNENYNLGHQQWMDKRFSGDGKDLPSYAEHRLNNDRDSNFDHRDWIFKTFGHNKYEKSPTYGGYDQSKDSDQNGKDHWVLKTVGNNDLQSPETSHRWHDQDRGSDNGLNLNHNIHKDWFMKTFVNKDVQSPETSEGWYEQGKHSDNSMNFNHNNYKRLGLKTFSNKNFHSPEGYDRIKSSNNDLNLNHNRHKQWILKTFGNNHKPYVGYDQVKSSDNDLNLDHNSHTHWFMKTFGNKELQYPDTSHRWHDQERGSDYDLNLYPNSHKQWMLKTFGNKHVQSPELSDGGYHQERNSDDNFNLNPYNQKQWILKSLVKNDFKSPEKSHRWYDYDENSANDLNLNQNSHTRNKGLQLQNDLQFPETSHRWHDYNENNDRNLNLDDNSNRQWVMNTFDNKLQFPESSQRWFDQERNDGNDLDLDRNSHNNWFMKNFGNKDAHSPEKSQSWYEQSKNSDKNLNLNNNSHKQWVLRTFGDNKYLQSPSISNGRYDQAKIGDANFNHNYDNHKQWILKTFGDNKDILHQRSNGPYDNPQNKDASFINNQIVGRSQSPVSSDSWYEPEQTMYTDSDHRRWIQREFHDKSHKFPISRYAKDSYRNPNFDNPKPIFKLSAGDKTEDYLTAGQPYISNNPYPGKNTNTEHSKWIKKTFNDGTENDLSQRLNEPRPIANKNHEQDWTANKNRDARQVAMTPESSSYGNYSPQQRTNSHSDHYKWILDNFHDGQQDVSSPVSSFERYNNGHSGNINLDHRQWMLKAFTNRRHPPMLPVKTGNANSEHQHWMLSAYGKENDQPILEHPTENIRGIDSHNSGHLNAKLNNVWRNGNLKSSETNNGFANDQKIEGLISSSDSNTKSDFTDGSAKNDIYTSVNGDNANDLPASISPGGDIDSFSKDHHIDTAHDSEGFSKDFDSNANSTLVSRENYLNDTDGSHESESNSNGLARTNFQVSILDNSQNQSAQDRETYVYNVTVSKNPSNSDEYASTQEPSVTDQNGTVHINAIDGQNDISSSDNNATVLDHSTIDGDQQTFAKENIQNNTTVSKNSTMDNQYPSYQDSEGYSSYHERSVQKASIIALDQDSESYSTDTNSLIQGSNSSELNAIVAENNSSEDNGTVPRLSTIDDQDSESYSADTNGIIQESNSADLGAMVATNNSFEDNGTVPKSSIINDQDTESYSTDNNGSKSSDLNAMVAATTDNQDSESYSMYNGGSNSPALNATVTANNSSEDNGTVPKSSATDDQDSESYSTDNNGSNPPALNATVTANNSSEDNGTVPKSSATDDQDSESYSTDNNGSNPPALNATVAANNSSEDNGTVPKSSTTDDQDSESYPTDNDGSNSSALNAMVAANNSSENNGTVLRPSTIAIQQYLTSDGTENDLYDKYNDESKVTTPNHKNNFNWNFYSVYRTNVKDAASN